MSECYAQLGPSPWLNVGEKGEIWAKVAKVVQLRQGGSRMTCKRSRVKGRWWTVHASGCEMDGM